jgi:hypothetical protein
METSKQVEKFVPNPTGKGGFQYNRFINMTEAELEAFTKLPKSERTVAQRLAFNRVKAADKSLPDMKEITDRTEGKAYQSMDVTSGGEKLEGLVIVRADANDTP